jgi:hypothetical protein
VKRERKDMLARRIHLQEGYTCKKDTLARRIHLQEGYNVVFVVMLDKSNSWHAGDFRSQLKNVWNAMNNDVSSI